MLKNVVLSAIDSIEFGDRRGKYSDARNSFNLSDPAVVVNERAVTIRQRHEEDT